MIFLQILFLLGGFILLIKGAGWLVDGASVIARRLGISELAIGLTIVAFGTSMPELLVNVMSSIEGANDLAIGNVLGSNIANILLILGIAATLRKIEVQTSTVWKEIPFSLLASAVLLIMANDRIVDGYPASELSRSDGLAFIAFFLIFLWYTFGMRRMEEIEETNGQSHRAIGLPAAVLFILIGLVSLTAGGKFVVDSAVTIAQAFGASQALIGLTIVAVGTSLPELATSIVAAMRGKADIAVGNIVGSNLFNTFWILGISAVIRPIAFSPALNLDIVVTIAATIFLFFAVHTGRIHRRIFFWRQRGGHVISRMEGITMLLVYVAYIGAITWRG